MICARALNAIVGFVTIAALCACSHPVELYCDDETPCEERYPDRPYCDVHGEYPASEGIGRTCIPYPWDAAITDAVAPGDGPSVAVDGAALDAPTGADAAPSDAGCIIADWNPLTVEATGNVGARPIAVVGSGGVVHVVYLHLGDGEVRHAVRNVAGVWTTTNATVASYSTGTGLGTALDAVTDDHGNVHVCFQDARDGELRYALWRKDTGLWSDESVDSYYSSGANCRIIVDPTGTLHVAYQRSNATDGFSLRYSRKPSGGVWSGEEIAAEGLIGTSGIALARASNGDLHVAYTGDPDTATPLRFATKPSGGSWSSAPLAADGTQPQLLVDGTDMLHLVYQVAGSMVVHRERPAGSNWSASSDITAGRLSTSFHRASDGAMFVTYWDSSVDTTIRLATKPVTGAWQKEPIATDASPFGSIVTDSLGHVHVAYWDKTNSDLDHAVKCR